MSVVTVDPWRQLRQWTAARIALGRTGVSQPTAPQLAFQLAHAQARDAVHMELDDEALADRLTASLGLQCIRLRSAAPDRATYLRRPDLCRRLCEQSRRVLVPASYEIGFVIADGLSALAIERHAEPFLREWSSSYSTAPLAIVKQGRVAVGDEVAQLLGVELVVMMIGERPGLSSPDSMGLYMTWQPRVGMTDERRNCISNVRPEGLGYTEAAARLAWLVNESRRLGTSGVAVKMGSGPPYLTPTLDAAI